MIPRKWYKIQT